MVCDKSDISKLALCNYKSDLEYQYGSMPENFLSVIAGLWQTIFNNAGHRPVVFKAVMGVDVVGIGCATSNRAARPDLAQFGAQLHILRVLKEAQRCQIGRRLLACMAANLYAGGARSAYMVVEPDNQDTLAFVTALGGQIVTEDLNQGAIVFAWGDLVSLINDAYKF